MAGCLSDAITVAQAPVVSVAGTNGVAKAGLPVYVFNDASYAGYNTITDVGGQASFTLPPGSYHFRSDLNGTEFWSGPSNHCTLPGCTESVVTVTVPLMVTVVDASGGGQAGLPVYAFDGDAYTGYNGTTDASGQAGFTLPKGSYRFRSDKNGTQFWSDTANDCTVPGCVSDAITVTQALVVSVVDTNGMAKAGLPVYVFNDASYTGYNGTTYASGQASFTLPQGSYHFRSDLNGTEFWSSSSNTCTLPGCTGDSVTTTVPLTVTVLDASNTPQVGVPVYAFDETTYTGYNGTTDANGLAVFTLPQGNYRFRADQGGAQYWSDTANDCPVPGCSGATVTLAPTSGMAPNGMLTLTAYQPGSDTAMIQASWTVPASEQIVSDGPVSTQKATQSETASFCLISQSVSAFNQNPIQVATPYANWTT